MSHPPTMFGRGTDPHAYYHEYRERVQLIDQMYSDGWNATERRSVHGCHRTNALPRRGPGQQPLNRLVFIFRWSAPNLDEAPAHGVFEIEKIEKIIGFVARQIRHQITVQNYRLPSKNIDHRPHVVGFDLEIIPLCRHGSAQSKVGVHGMPLIGRMRHGGRTIGVALRWSECPDKDNRCCDQQQRKDQAGGHYDSPSTNATKRSGARTSGS